MPVNLQPLGLKNDLLTLSPLVAGDFEKLYEVASDPLIWEQHPNRSRYQRTVFETFFRGAMESRGAFLVCDTATGRSIGSSRFYDHDPKNRTIFIGYTFIARDCWGRGYNAALKTLMLHHAFTFADCVIFHVGAVNIRSQKSMERLGARKVGQLEVEYYGEPTKLNFEYRIERSEWL